jgi:polyether ionophore transport system permease protein
MSSLTGTRTLVRLALRRDRINLPVWIIVLGLVPASTAGAYAQLYPEAKDRAALTAGGQNPAVAVLYGKAYDLSTAGGFTAWRYGVFLGVFIGLMAVFTVTRHTRAEEDTGRLELLSAGVLGRYASLTAAVIVSGGASILVGLLQALGMMGSGLPASGSFALGVGVAACGLVFTGIAAITAQIFTYSRTTNGVACAVIGVLFLLRAVGDSSTSATWASWLSPIGWTELVRPFADERFWVLLLPLALAVVLIGVAYRLQPRRDVGLGLVPPKPGPATAAAGLASPFALAWRLHRGPLIGWTLAMLVIGAVFGAIATGIGDLVGSSEQTRLMFERMGGAQGIVDAYIGALGGIYGLTAGVYAVQATLRMRAEESALLLEPLLATKVTRARWAASHLAFAIFGPAVLLAAVGLGTGLTYGLRINDVGTQVPHVLGATLAQLPAVLVMAALAALLFGLLPNLTAVSWALLTVFLLITLFGPILQVGQAVLDVSPFSHVPKLPAAAFNATPLVWLTGIAVVVFAGAFLSFRRRDIG